MRFLAVALIASFASGASNAEIQEVMPSGANAPTVCGERSEMVKALHEQFAEEAQAVGQVDKNAVIEVFVSPAGSWTILATGTDGMSCLVASGEGWEDANNLIVGTDL